jgi:hypothetical protein
MTDVRGRSRAEAWGIREHAVGPRPNAFVASSITEILGFIPC